MLSRTEVKEIPNMSWDLYKRINKFDYLILKNSNISRISRPVPILFRRDGLHLVVVAAYHEGRWKNVNSDELQKYDVWGGNGGNDMFYVILESFGVDKPKGFVNRFYLPDLFKKGFQLTGGKSKRWYNNVLYHEQFMDALDSL